MMLKAAATNDLRFIGLPSLSNPRILIPMASSRVQARAFDLYSPGSIQGKIFKWMGKAGAVCGMLNLTGHGFVRPVQDFKGTETIAPVLKREVLADLQNAWEAALDKGVLSFALSLGEPNRYRKVTALIFDKTANPVAFAKVACTDQAKALVANEVAALGQINLSGFRGLVAPDLLGHGKVENIAWILQSPLLHGRSSPNNLKKEHFSFLAELSQASAQVMPLNSWDVVKYLKVAVSNPVLAIKPGFESETPFILDLARRFQTMPVEDAQRPWPFTAAHGDFAPWNMRLVDGRLGLFDWEYFMPLAPAGWDLLYFVFRVENLIKRQSLERIWHKLEQGAYLDKIMLFENMTGIEISGRKLLAMLVMLSMALDLLPKKLSEN
jgi:hypothetical protein